MFGGERKKVNKQYQLQKKPREQETHRSMSESYQLGIDKTVLNFS
jgi:hypothetical protein